MGSEKTNRVDLDVSRKEDYRYYLTVYGVKPEAHELGEGRTLMGRKPDWCHIVVSPALMSVSRLHCSFLVEGEAVKVRDEHSCNGTIVNGRMIEPGIDVPTKEGDEIDIGGIIVRIHRRN